MKTTKVCKCFASIWVCAMLAIPAAQGTTIVAVSGPNDNTTGFSMLSNVLMVGFSTATGYTNVAIEVSFSSFIARGDWNLAAYLTDQVGPGTTAGANEIASNLSLISIPVSPILPPYTITPYTVFSGLTLPAGTYYLTWGGTRQTPASGNVYGVSSPTGSVAVVTDVGASVTRPFATRGTPAPYLPASGFNDLPGNNRWFTVTGDAVAAVPEPSTMALCLGGLLMLVGGRLRRRLL